PIHAHRTLDERRVVILRRLKGAEGSQRKHDHDFSRQTPTSFFPFDFQLSTVNLFSLNSSAPQSPSYRPPAPASQPIPPRPSSAIRLQLLAAQPARKPQLAAIA